ncbi:hypothetical protein DMN91_005561 [Ooceraea biroi]|uniref:Uncharacterized protein n=1 Tax=Ooceraea biroi TaxID=2015173 RepID=A0A3L8DMY8_OOCBI|nr:hypothetical protein DMN91_005561 [Ooceraea biroi]
MRKNVGYTYAGQAIRTAHRSRGDRARQNHRGEKIFRVWLGYDYKPACHENLQKTSDGMSTEITTTDDARINVTFREPLDSNASGYIEVRGTVKSKSTMSCSSFVCFPQSMTKEFDADGYNTMVHMRCALGNKLDSAMDSNA